MSKRFQIVLNGKSYEAEVEEVGAFPKEMVCTSSPVGSSPVQSAPAQSSNGSAKTVEAPMAGVVIGLSVKVGDRINEGDVFVKIEAMKMENEVPSTVSGTVTNILVSDGQQVQAGDALIEVK